jgi:hypothetical protein
VRTLLHTAGWTAHWSGCDQLCSEIVQARAVTAGTKLCLSQATGYSEILINIHASLPRRSRPRTSRGATRHHQLTGNPVHGHGMKDAASTPDRRAPRQRPGAPSSSIGMRRLSWSTPVAVSALHGLLHRVKPWLLGESVRHISAASLEPLAEGRPARPTCQV